MSKIFTNYICISSLIIVFIVGAKHANAQTFTANTLGANVRASAIAKDAGGDIFVLEDPADVTTGGEILKYVNGASTPTVVVGSIEDDEGNDDEAFGMVVDSQGNIYVTTSSGATNGALVKYAAGTYAKTILLNGNGIASHFTGLAIDSNDILYVAEFNSAGNTGGYGKGDYEVAEYNTSGSQIAVLYNGLAANAFASANSTPGGDKYSAISALAVDGNGNIYVGDAFDITHNTDGGHIYKLTKSGGYSLSTVASSGYCTALAVDPTGNLFASIAPAGPPNYSLVEYIGGSGSPVNLYSSLGYKNGWYPYGIALSTAYYGLLNTETYPEANSPETITVSNFSTSSTLPVTISKDDSRVAVRFGAATQVSTTLPDKNFNTPSYVTGLSENPFAAWEFAYDGSQIEFYYHSTNAGKVRYFVDNQAVNAGAIYQVSDGIAGDLVYQKLTFSSAKMRTIRIEGWDVFKYGGLKIQTGNNIYTSGNYSVNSVFLGDSWWEESAAFWCNSNAVVMGKMMNWNVFSSGSGGTGYYNNDEAGRLNFAGRVPTDVIPYHPIRVWIAGGTNDVAAIADSVITTARYLTLVDSTINLIKTALPNAEIVMVSSWRQTGAARAGRPTVDSCIRAVAAKYGAYFITTAGIITGTGNVGAPTGVGNADSLMAANGHPTTIGQQYIASQLLQRYIALKQAQPSNTSVNGTQIFVNNGGENTDSNTGNLLQLFSGVTTQASNVTFSKITANTAAVTWTNGNGISRAVFISNNSSGSPLPVNNTTYTPNSNFGSGGAAGSGWYCVYNGTATSANITGLTGGQTYRVMVAEYNGSPGTENYLTTTSSTNPNNFTTAPVAVTAVTTNTGSNALTNAASVNYTVTFSAAEEGLTASNFTLTTNGLPGASIGTPTTTDNITWTVPVNTGTGNGTIILNLDNANGLSNQVSTILPYTGQTYTIDNTPPTVSSITMAGISPNNAGTDQFTVTFSEPVTGVAAGNFTATETNTVSNTGISVTQVNAGVYTVTINGVSGDGTLRLDLNAGTGIADLAGNAISSSFTGGDVYTIDNTPPTVSSITMAGISPNNAGTDQFTVTFSEPVTGVAAGNFTATETNTVSNTGISVTQVNAGVYTVTINGVSGDGTLRLDLNAGTGIADLAGNTISSGFTGGEVYTIDNTPPTVSSITLVGASPNNATSDQFTVTFSEPVTGVAANDFTITTTSTPGGTALANSGFSNITGSGTTYTLTVGGVSGDGTMRLDLNANSTGITDAAGNGCTAPFTGGGIYDIEHTAPSVTSITGTTPSPSNPTNTTNITYTVNFSEAVTGVTADDFTLTASGTTGVIQGITGSGSSYTVTVNNISGDGTLRLDLNAGTGIADLAGNAISSSFTGGDVYTIDNTPPTVSSITMAGISPNNAGTDQFTVTFSEPVTGVAAGNFTATETNTVSNTGISVTQVNAGVYTVTINGVSGDGTLRLDLNAGTGIADLAGNAISSSFTGGDVYTIDNTPPTVSSITMAGISPNNAGTDQFTVTFSEPVTGVAAGNFTATETNTVSNTGISVTQVNAGVYTVTINGVSGDGTLRLDLNAGTGIADLAGNAISSSFTGGDVYTIDNTPPTVSSITMAGISPNNAGTDQFTVTFSEPVTGVAAGNFTATETNTVSNTGISVTQVNAGVYTVTINGVSGDGTLRLDLNAGTGIADLAGNAISSSFTGGDVYTIDNTPPTVSSITMAGISPNNAGTDQFTVTFSEPVTGVAAGNFTATETNTVSNTGISVTQVNAGVYTVTINGVSGDGTLRLDLNAGTGIADLAGNTISSGFTGGEVYTIDNTPPTVSSITLVGASPNNATSDQFTVTFSEPVTGVAANDFTITTTSTPGGTALANSGFSNITGSGTTYTLTVGGVSGDGTMRLDLNANSTGITDAAGNGCTAPFTGGGIYDIEHTAPSVTSITGTTPSPSNPTNTTNITYTVNFSEAVTGVTADDFTLTASGTTGVIQGITGSGSSYTVTVNNISGDGTLRLDLNAGTGIADLAGNAISSSFTGGDVYTIDNTPPTITMGSPSVTQTVIGPVSYAVTYADANFNTSTLSTRNITLIPTGTATGTVSVSGMGTATPEVIISNISGVGTLGISIGAGTASDLAGNLAPASSPSTVFNVLSNDASLSNITLSSGTLSPSFSSGTTSGYTANVPYTNNSITVRPATNNVNASVQVNGFSASTPVNLNIGPNLVTIVVTAQDGATQLTYTLTVTRAAASDNAFFSSLKTTPNEALTTVNGTSYANYTASVANNVSTIEVVPTTADPTAVVTVNGIPVTSGVASGPITLAVGSSNVINTVVTAQDGVTIKTYTITVTRAPSSVATLSKLNTVPGEVLTTVSGPGYVNYTASVANTVSTIEVAPTTTDPTAMVTVNGVPVTSGVASGPITLAVGSSNVINVVVTAQDGVTSKTYTITVTRAPSSVATLSKLNTAPGEVLTTVSGPGYVNYTAPVANTVSSIEVIPTTTDPTAKVTVNGMPVTSGVASGPIALAVGSSNVINTVVTAQDGVTSKTYTITVTRAPSSIATLSKLNTAPGEVLTTVSGPGYVNYTAPVANTVSSIEVIPTTTDPTAKVTVNGMPVTSGVASGPIALAVGSSNVINTVVTAQDGVTSKTYTITVTRAPSSIATLSTLSTTPVETLTTADGPSFANYTAPVANTISTIEVVPTTTDPTAKVTVNGVAVASGVASGPIALAVGSSNVINTVVTAQDGTTSKTYTLTVTRAASSIATLSTLSTAPVETLTTADGPSFANYTTPVANTVSTIEVVPTTTDPTAKVTVNGVAVTSGVASGPIALAVGSSNVINTVVTAQDGVTSKTYTITVTRAPSSIATLSTLSTTPVETLTTADGPSFANYTAQVANTISTIEVVPTTTDPTAKVTVNGVAVTSGVASGPIALAVGFSNVINVVVTAQDGVTSKTYTITVTRAPSSVATLSALSTTPAEAITTVSNGPTTYTKTASVANTVSSIEVIPTTTDPTATITVNGVLTISGTASDPIALALGSSNVITMVVTAQDGVTAKTYTLTVTRAASSIATLSKLNTVPGEVLTTVSGPGYINYTASVANTVSSIKVVPTTTDPMATLTVNGMPAISGTASGSIALAVGSSNIINTVVTAQDGITSKTYTITVTRAGAPTANDAYPIVNLDPLNNPEPGNDGILVHQAISPNGDGVNDYLSIENIESYPENKLMIMNPGGTLVYEAKGYDNLNKVFDGHSNKTGQMQLPGTYFYSLDYTVKGVIKHKTGFLVLKY